jgi:peptidyl-prolyl cis-trans isomerase C
MKRIFAAVLAVAFTAAIALAATPGKPATNSAPVKSANPSNLFGDTVIAKGKGFEIKRSQLDDALIGLKSTAAARGQRITPDQSALFEQQLLERLIQIQLLLGRATKEDQDKGKETSAKRLETIKTRAGTEEALNRQLKSVGMSQEELRTRMIDEAVAETVLERELHINVSEAEVKQYYEENPAKFEQPEMVRVSHILLGTRSSTGEELNAEQKADKRKQMEALLKRAREGEDFAKLVKEYSEDTASKEKGGEYTFGRGGRMVPEFEGASFSLETNQVSDIVTTQYGYHIIKLLEKLPAKKIEFAKVSTEIQDYLKQQATGKQIPAYMDKLKKEAGVEILDEKLKARTVLEALTGTNNPAPPQPEK